MVKALILLITCCTLSAADHTVALTILAEARGEGLRGMAAVACVIAQRAKERCITPKEVCLQRKQFSCWDSGKDLSYLLDTPQAEHALHFEKHIHRMKQEVTGGANHYHALHVRPYWADKSKKTKIIGNHVFYKL